MAYILEKFLEDKMEMENRRKYLLFDIYKYEIYADILRDNA